ncbi:MAG: hypothetical protein GY834_02445 [Bacteroidetes bacterium]|nr:hypothetical protein [Bacteroidota bacterium]
MKVADKHKMFLRLREEYPFLVFENYTVKLAEDVLSLTFKFNISDKYLFEPQLTFPLKNKFLKSRLSDIDIRNFVFHIGMIELISYWKACCCPEIIIKPHLLDKEQINWWKKLYFNGLGEFFYLNGIKTNQESFVKITSESTDRLRSQHFGLDDSVIVPIGGGKDSIVSLALLNESHFTVTPLILNANPARRNSILVSGIPAAHTIEIQRTIHPQLLELNNLGFLNGHTPFSAALAFISLLASVVYNRKYIALSNESSANESTIINTNINHQYSKSFEFEQDLRKYVNDYISTEINYFSFLRPLNELQIARLFSKNKAHFSTFRSCNVGSKTDEWCGKCPKCLFTFIILSPFIEEKELEIIFGSNLLDNSAFLPIFDQLIGATPTKPFECVGTYDDINVALLLKLKSTSSENLPKLLEYYVQTKVYTSYKNFNSENILNRLNPDHNLTSEFLSLINSERI